MAAVDQERYAFGRGTGCDAFSYGGCHSGLPTSVELQIQPAAALGAGVPGAALTRTRVIPITSPGGSRSSSATDRSFDDPDLSYNDMGRSHNDLGRSSSAEDRSFGDPDRSYNAPDRSHNVPGRSSSAPGLVSILLPCMSRVDTTQSATDDERRVVRHSMYRFSEDEGDEVPAATSHSTPPHLLHVEPEAFQSPVTLNHLHLDPTSSHSFVLTFKSPRMRAWITSSHHHGEVEWPWVTLNRHTSKLRVQIEVRSSSASDAVTWTAHSYFGVTLGDLESPSSRGLPDCRVQCPTDKEVQGTKTTFRFESTTFFQQLYVVSSSGEDQSWSKYNRQYSRPEMDSFYLRSTSAAATSGTTEWRSGELRRRSSSRTRRRPWDDLERRPAALARRRSAKKRCRQLDNRQSLVAEPWCFRSAGSRDIDMWTGHVTCII